MNRSTTRIALPLALAVVFGVSACSTSYEPPQIGDELVWTSDGDDERPGWTANSSAQESDEMVLFVGMADNHSTQRGARDAALSDARRLITQYAQTAVTDNNTIRESAQGTQDEIQNPEIVRERVTDEIASFAVSEMEHRQWRYEQWRNQEQGQTFYTGFVQVGVEAEAFDVSPETLAAATAEEGSGGESSDGTGEQ